MTDPYRPVLADTFDGFSGCHLKEEDLYVARYAGDSAAFNALAGVSQATELTDEETVTRLNRAFGENLSIETWNERFSVGEAEGAASAQQ